MSIETLSKRPDSYLDLVAAEDTDDNEESMGSSVALIRKINSLSGEKRISK